MCVPIFTPDIPKTTSVLTTTPKPKKIDEKASRKRKEDRRRASASLGRQSTLLTGGEGLTQQAFTTKKKLLGE